MVITGRTYSVMLLRSIGEEDRFFVVAAVDDLQNCIVFPLGGMFTLIHYK